MILYIITPIAVQQIPYIAISNIRGIPAKSAMVNPRMLKFAGVRIKNRIVKTAEPLFANISDK